MDRRKRIRRGVIFIFFTGLGLTAAFVAKNAYSGESENDGVTSGNRESFAVYGVEVPEKVSFAGEPMPLDLFDVKESLDRELLSNTYFHSQTIRLIKLANRYFPEIEPILKKNLVPDDFKYLAVAESGLSQAVSPARAVGFWQLLKATAQENGLEVGNEVDERYHISKSTEAACKYLISSYKKYGNWSMTAASYNAGRRGMNEQIGRQKKENYYDLLLNEETARYLYRVVALKLIFENPTAYGFNISENELYPVIPSKVVVVDSSVANFADFAAEYDTNYKILKYLNPWLRDTKLTVSSGNSYEIIIPEKGYRRADAWELK